MTHKPDKKEDIRVFIASRDATCDACGRHLGSHAWIVLEEEVGAICLECADLEHLVFLPAGDMALTRRARKHSRLCAVVLKWSQARKRYERQGMLVEEPALDKAESECDADVASRVLRREQAAIRRAGIDKDYVQHFAAEVRRLYPNMPKDREKVIAEHACRKYSGRIGRSAAAREFDPDAVSLAVLAHIRHAETNYDKLLMSGRVERFKAREAVRDRVAEIHAHWRA